MDNPTNDEYQHIRLFFYGGLSIEDASDTTLCELFGEKEIIQIDYESVDAAKIDVFVQDPNQKRYVFESMSKRPVAVGETGNQIFQLIVWKSNFILEKAKTFSKMLKLSPYIPSQTIFGNFLNTYLLLFNFFIQHFCQMT